ncbi:MAG: glycosyltransferase family 2 protein [Oscillospiraceae bacterium]
MNTSERPLVSIAMMTYNHEKFIARAIESVLMQEVNFRYELVIGEDCSTDNTRQIVMEYAEKYPGIIRAILHPHNVGMQENTNIMRRECKGKYRGNLEGDDFWITTDKLQKQVDFLESHPDFICIGGDFVCVDDDEKPCNFPWGDITHTYCQDEEYTTEHLKRWLLPSHISATLFRNVFADCGQEELERFERVQVLGDRRVYMYLVLQGRVYHQKETVMVRRILTKSSTSFTSAVKKSNWQEINYDWLLEAEKFALERFNYKLDLSARKELHWLGSIRMFYHNPTSVNYQIMRSIFKKSHSKFRYMQIAASEFFSKVREVYKRDGFFKGTKNGLSKIKKVLDKFRKNRSESSVNNQQNNSVLNSYSKK